MSTVTTSLAYVQQGIIRYGFPISLTLGNIGNLLLVAIFSRKRHRQSSGSLYLLAAAVFSIVGINWGIGTNMYALYQPPDPFIGSLVLCRTRGYILQSSSLLYKIMIVLTCVDRFAVTSTRVRIRALSQPNTAAKIIGGATAFGLLISIHLPINQTIERNRCGAFGTYGLFFSIYLVCIFGFILPSASIVFSLLIVKNLKAVRARVQPLSGTDQSRQNVLRKADLTLIRLVLVEVLAGIILTTLYPSNSLYTILTSHVLDKSADRLAIESFVSFLGLIVLFYLNYCITFYLYIALSKPFRQEAKQWITKYMRRSEREQTLTIRVSTRRRAEPT